METNTSIVSIWNLSEEERMSILKQYEGAKQSGDDAKVATLEELFGAEALEGYGKVDWAAYSEQFPNDAKEIDTAIRQLRPLLDQTSISYAAKEEICAIMKLDRLVSQAYGGLCGEYDWKDTGVEKWQICRKTDSKGASSWKPVKCTTTQYSRLSFTTEQHCKDFIANNGPLLDQMMMNDV